MTLAFLNSPLDFVVKILQTLVRRRNIWVIIDSCLNFTMLKRFNKIFERLNIVKIYKINNKLINILKIYGKYDIILVIKK